MELSRLSADRAYRDESVAMLEETHAGDQFCNTSRGHSTSPSSSQSRHIQGRTKEFISRTLPQHRTGSPEYAQADSPLLGCMNRQDARSVASSHSQLDNVGENHSESELETFAVSKRGNRKEKADDAIGISLAQVSRLTRSWMPYTLRWWYIGLILTFTSALLIVVIVLLVVSRQKNGLKKDDDSDSLLFGWRFSPTLFAVIYAQLASMLFEDIRRTEPFALLARPMGTTAACTLLQRSDAWWTVLRTSLSTSNGKRSWALFCACLVNVLAFLAIAPLSSSLLTSMDVTISEDCTFSSLFPKADTMMSLRPQGDTFLRTISNLLQNVTTSAWIIGPKLLFPSWPEGKRTAPLGARVSDDLQTWHTHSLVYQLEYNCQSAQMMGHQNTTRRAGRDNSTYFPISVELRTADDCSRLVDLPQEYNTTDFLLNGGVMWSCLPPSANFPGRVSFDSESKQNCDANVDVMLLSTPWSYQGPNEAVQLSSNTTIKAQLCSSKLYQAKMPVTITNSRTQTTIDFDETILKSQRTELAASALNVSSLRQLLIDPQWSRYLAQPLREAGQSLAMINKFPEYEGAAAALGAFYQWNFTVMMEAEDLALRARQIQQRLFGELIQVSADQPGATEVLPLPGSIVTTERRIVVVPQVAYTLLSLLVLSILLMVILFWIARPSNRPLHLDQDPATVVGLASQLPYIHPTPRLQKLSLASRKDIETNLQNGVSQFRIGLTPSKVVVEDIPDGRQRNTALNSDWKPTAIRLWALSTLLAYIAVLLVAVLILYHFATQHKLYKTAFVYRATLWGMEKATFAPYSIIPTLLAVVVSLIWDLIDKTIRRLQPYISTAKGPKQIKNGSGSSYQSTYLAWAVVKALKKKHWLLATVSTGSVICKILVVAMSALFERQNSVLSHSTQALRFVEPRQIPHVTSDAYNAALSRGEEAGINGVPGRILKNLFTNAQSNWMYSATIQLTLDGAEPPWSKDGWSFLPVSLAPLPGSSNASQIQNLGASTAETSRLLTSTNFTFSTTATRARLECEVIPDIANTSTWLEEVQYQKFRNSTKDGLTPTLTAYDPTHNMFGYNYTSLLTHPGRLACCLNQSLENQTQPLAIGYWSSTGDVQYWPNANKAWPMNVTVKWLRGLATPWPSEINYVKKKNFTLPYSRSLFGFTKVPSLQALNCRPVIESVAADVTTDYASGIVQDFTLLGKPQPELQAWSDPFVTRNESQMYPDKNRAMYMKVQVSTSYGVSFMNALLGASDLSQLGGSARNKWSFAGGINQNGELGLLDTSFFDEFRSKDETFKIRDSNRGLNLDLMSYAMYTLAGKDPDALLNATTMLHFAQRTFQTYFQHFVSTKLDSNATFGAYQPVGQEVDQALFDASSKFAKAEWKPPYSYPKLNTSRTVTGTVSTRIEILHMNPAATWISVIGLSWLLCTTTALLVLHRRYLGPLVRDIESIADVLILVAGSESFLKLIHETNPKHFVKNQQVLTKLGWFRARDGQVRWGIEVVGDVGLGAVEWLDGPIGVVWEGLESNE